jgi:tRNA pseudouridine32 synthase/23S rRNA pseudouridine746 synthase
MKDFDYHPPEGPLVYLHQDHAVLVMDKPSGLLSVPGKLEGRQDSLETRLRRAHPESLLVHRLDCDTSGVIIFARNKAAQGFLGQEFEQRRAKKSYVARVRGVIAEDSGRVDLPLGTDWPNRPRQMVDAVNGRPAVTDWQVIARSEGETRVRLTPLTGRSHQLRVHMLEIGNPILGDPIYDEADAARWPRLMLHAETLALHHPESHEWVSFTAPCPF